MDFSRTDAMKLDKSFLQSKFARRILTIFISCTIIPLLALFVLSFKHISDDLRDQNLEQLKQVTKSISVSIYERLLLLEAELQQAGFLLSQGAGNDLAPVPVAKYKAEINRFKAMAVYDQDGVKTNEYGATDDFPELRPEELLALKNIQNTLMTRAATNQFTRIFMAAPVIQTDKTRRYLIGELDGGYLRQVISENVLPVMAEFFVLDASHNLLISSITPEVNPSEIPAAVTEKEVSGHFLWKYKKKNYRAGFNKLFLKARFSSPDWTIILAQPDDYTLESVNRFKKIFPLVILLSLLIVIFLSIIFVRKSLIPLEKLKEGTHRILAGNFMENVVISSGDEFEDLADSFNSMSQKLSLQFNELKLSAAIGHFSAKVLKTDDLINAILSSIKEYLNFDRTALLLLNETTSRMCYKAGYGFTENKEESLNFFFNAHRAMNTDNLIEKALLTQEPVFSIETAKRKSPGTETILDEVPDRLSIYVPIVYEEKATGALVFENRSKKPIPVTLEKNSLMGLGSQIAVSLSNNTSFQKLQESEERFRKSFDQAASGISLIATDGSFLTVNAYILKMLGYEKNEFLSKTLEDISNPGHYMAEMNSHRRLLNKEMEFDIYEKKFIHKSGHEIWGLVSISLLFDINSDPLYYIMHVQNLSELKEAQEIQKELESQLRRAQKMEKPSP